MKKALSLTALLVGLAATPAAVSHLDPAAFNQSYRQSVFALMGANFGPMTSMIKGEMPWNDAMFQAFAEDLAKVTELNIDRGFPANSKGGLTRA